MRLAWFTPLPPTRSGISGYSAELLPALCTSHAIEVFVASADEVAWAAAHGIDARSAHDFVWRQHAAPYDLVVYQLGNAWCHDYMWPYVFQYPGLVVLHDGHLHHARAWSLLRRRRYDDYRAEVAAGEPGAPADAAEIGLSGFAGPIYYLWPLVRSVVTSARAVAVHSAGLARQLADAYPDATIRRIRMGVSNPLPADEGTRRRETRRRYGIPADALVVAAFGGITPEKRIPQLVAALGRAAAWAPDVRLLLVGAPAAHLDAAAEAAAAGLGNRTIVTGFVDDGELDDCLAASDLAACLRWPTAQETSASWLRCLAAGLPTIVTDLAHQAELPMLDPRDWTVHHGYATLEAPDPIAVAIDILDEDHSLGLALKRLVTDRPLRERLGRAARRAWAADFTLAAMRADYEPVLAEAARRPAPDVSLPAHLRPNPLDAVATLIRPFGLTTAELGLEPR